MLHGHTNDFGTTDHLHCKFRRIVQWSEPKELTSSVFSATIFGQVAQALIIGSVYYGTPLNTGSFFAKGAVLFFAVLLSALQSIVEINTLYAQRPIVSKHKSYAFYHPFTEALAGIVADLPIKFCVTTVFNIILYFLSGLRREPAQFFVFFLFNFMAMLTMSAIFRTTAAVTKTISAALAIAGVMVLWIVIYTGFTITRAYMKVWFRWSSWINPVAYAFEALLVNEVHGRRFPCAPTSLVPPYGTGDNFQCAVAGAVAGELDVSGDDWVHSSYGYSYSHIWRNLGFMFAFMIFFYVVYLTATEINSDSTSTAEFLVFRRGHVPAHLQATAGRDEEDPLSQTSTEKGAQQSEDKQKDRLDAIPAQKGIFTWRNVTLDIKIKGEPRRLLDGISGWVKPGTLTALMGTSGAGKTTLLDALAQRTNIGVLTGDMVSRFLHILRTFATAIATALAISSQPQKIEIRIYANTCYSLSMANPLIPLSSERPATCNNKTCTWKQQLFERHFAFLLICANQKVSLDKKSMTLWRKSSSC